MQSPFESEVVKIIIGSLGAIVITVLGWTGSRQARRIDLHDMRIRELENRYVSEEKYEKEMLKVSEKLEAHGIFLNNLDSKVAYSVKRFEDEHGTTRDLIRKTNEEIILELRRISNA